MDVYKVKGSETIEECKMDLAVRKKLSAAYDWCTYFNFYCFWN